MRRRAFSKKDRDLLLRGARYYLDERRVMGEHWEEWLAVRRLLVHADPAKESVYRAASRAVMNGNFELEDNLRSPEMLAIRKAVLRAWAVERATRRKK